MRFRDVDIAQAVGSISPPWRIVDTPPAINTCAWRPVRDPGQLWPSPRRVMRELTHIVARAFWAAAYPCCLGYRYGHGWKVLRVAPATASSGGPPIPVQLDEREIITGLLPVTTTRGNSTVTDYLAVIQGPPLACPTCGHPPPRDMVEAWERHVRRCTT